MLPVVVGSLLPGLLNCDIDPDESWWTRLIQLVASGGVSAFVVWVPILFLIRSRRLRAAYLSLLLPLAIILQGAQVVFFHAFGTQIDERILGLFQDNATALWAFARAEYRLDWVIAAAGTASALMAWSIHRRRDWFPCFGTKASVAAVLLVVFSTTLSFALRLNVEGASNYSSSKLSEAPLYRAGLLARTIFTERSAPDVAGVLARTAEIEAASTYDEIVRRLGTFPETHIVQKVDPPAWLKRKPAHVFCFLLESFEQDFIDLPEMESVAPHLRRFSREGIGIPRMISASGATIDAVHASMAGVTAQLRYPGPRALERLESDTLPRLMERAGYRSVFYAASHRKFAGKGDACEAYGFDAFIGCPDVAPDISANEWGVDDASFFEWTRGQMKPLGDAPHFVTFLNVSNHPPFSAPVDELWSDDEIPEEAVKRFVGGSRQEKCRYAKHVRFADKAMGEMVDWLDETYPGSLFVFFGDHCGPKFRREKDFHVPFILWGDEVVDSGVDASGWFGAQMDIPSTLAQLVLPAGGEYRSLGRPVWSEDPSRVSVGSGNLLFRKAGSGEICLSPQLRRPHSKQDQDQETLAYQLKGSAIRALSWSYLNHEPIDPASSLGQLAKLNLP